MCKVGGWLVGNVGCRSINFCVLSLLRTLSVFIWFTNKTLICLTALSLSGITRGASYDRVRGLDQHEGALSRNLAGTKWRPRELAAGGMVHSDPVFGLYMLDTC